MGYLVGTNDFVQTQLHSKTDKATTYTKTEVDNGLALKQHKLTFPSSEGANTWGLYRNLIIQFGGL